MSALNQGRYKWCHDKVLAVLANVLEQEPIHTSVHPAIFFCLSEVESQWQQARHRIPVILFLSSVFVVPLVGDPKTLKMIYIVDLPQMPEKNIGWLRIHDFASLVTYSKLITVNWPVKFDLLAQLWNNFSKILMLLLVCLMGPAVFTVCCTSPINSKICQSFCLWTPCHIK